MIRNVYLSSGKVHVILWQILIKPEFPQQVFETFLSIKFHGNPWAELFHADRLADGQTDVTKLIVAFRNSANSPKHCSFILSNLHVFFPFSSLFHTFDILYDVWNSLPTFYLQTTTKNTVYTCIFP
jgi:hypothetical protein